MAQAPTPGRIVHCWPDGFEAPNPPPGQELKPLTCAGIITGIEPTDGEVSIHFFLPRGSNGYCHLPAEPVDVPTRGRWWWPPRT